MMGDELRPKLLECLKRLGFEGFRHSQEASVIAGLQGKDCLVLAPTGGGKSLCYTLPAVWHEGRKLVVVVSPLIALMQDQVANLRARGVAAEYLASVLADAERARVLSGLKHGTGLGILLVTPELLATDKFKELLQALYRKQALALFAIDEAHCISSWGHQFRPAYRQLGSLRRAMPGVPLLALTATASTRVQQDIQVQLGMKDPVRLIASFNRPNITYEVVLLDARQAGHRSATAAATLAGRVVAGAEEVGQMVEMDVEEEAINLEGDEEEASAGGRGGGWGSGRSGVGNARMEHLRRLMAIHVLGRGSLEQEQGHSAEVEGGAHGTGSSSSSAKRVGAKGGSSTGREAGGALQGCAIVYVHRRADAAGVVHALRAAFPQLRAEPYHAGLPDAKREAVMTAWAARKLDVVVATVAFGMGIDRADVRLVVHWCVPATLEGYYQESGRGGRDGQPAHAVLYYAHDDRQRLDWVLRKEASRAKGRKRGGKGAAAAAGSASAQDQPHAWEAFGRVVEYALTPRCRRAVLLAHFGESLAPGSCQGCDYCRNPQGAVEEAHAQKEAEACAGRCGLGATLVRPLRGRKRGRGGADPDAYGMGGGGDDSEEDGDEEEEEEDGMDADLLPDMAAAAAAAERARAEAVKATAGSQGGNKGGQQPQTGDEEDKGTYLEAMMRLEEEYESAHTARGGLAELMGRKSSKSAPTAASATPVAVKPSQPAARVVGGDARGAAVGRLHNVLKDNPGCAGLPEGLLQRVAACVEAACVEGKETSAPSVYKGIIINAASRCKAAPSIAALEVQGKRVLQHASLADVLPQLLQAEVRAIKEAATQADAAGQTGSSIGQTGTSAGQTGGTVGEAGSSAGQTQGEALSRRLSLLSEVRVSVELLAASGIGKEVRALKQLRCVSEAAGKVVDAWKAQVVSKTAPAKQAGV